MKKTHPADMKYHGLVSSVIIFVVAVLVMIAGIISIIGGLKSDEPLYGMPPLLLGIICVVVACLLFIISNIAEDIHRQAFLTEFYGEETINYHNLALRRLQRIDEMLQQEYSRDPAQSWSPRKASGGARDEKNEPYFESNKERRQSPDDSADFSARFDTPDL